jgi:hypothetical protein
MHQFDVRVLGTIGTPSLLWPQDLQAAQQVRIAAIVMAAVGRLWRNFKLFGIFCLKDSQSIRRFINQCANRA